MARIEGTTGETAEVEGGRLLVSGPAITAVGNGVVPILQGDIGEVVVASEQMWLYDQVDGAAINANIWEQGSTTMTIAQAGGYMHLNATAITTLSTHALLRSVKRIPTMGDMPVILRATVLVINLPLTGATAEIGLMTATTNSAPNDGAYFRWKTNGDFVCVVNFGGTEIESAQISPPAANTDIDLAIAVFGYKVQFLIDSVPVATIENGTANPYPFSESRVSVLGRVYTAASAPASAPQLKIGSVAVTQGRVSQNRSWRDTLVANGRGLQASPVTPFAQTGNHANSTVPANATLSNTAAGYTALGGKFAFLPVGGAETDYALFGYQVPVGHQLIITGLNISVVNLGAAVATTATLLDWALGLNASAISLALSDAFSTGVVAPRRIQLGMQSFAIADPIGKQAPDIVRAFDTPLVVDSGRFVTLILRLPVSTATASQVIRGQFALNGYFE